MKTINPLWLYTFTTLVDCGHFTETAKRLHMTQPGVSQHIKKLETQLDTALLQRTGKRFDLTREGQLLYEYAHHQRTAEHEFLQALHNDTPFEGCCRIGCSGALATLVYPRLLDMQITHPGLTFHLEAAPNKRIHHSIHTGDIDFGIVTKKEDDPFLRYTDIGRSQLLLILPEQYRTHPITLDLLHTIGFIDHPDGQHYIRQIINANFLPHIKEEKKSQKQLWHKYIPFKTGGYINQITQILLPVSKGIGFTVLPASIVSPYANSHTVFIPTLPQPVYEQQFLVHKANHTLAARHRHLLSIMNELIVE